MFDGAVSRDTPPPRVPGRDLYPHDQLRRDFAGNFGLSQRAACKTPLYEASQACVIAQEMWLDLHTRVLFIAQSDHGIDTVARRAGTKVASSRRSQSRDGEAVCPPRLCLTLFERIAKESPVSSEPRRRLFTDTSGLTSRQRQLMALVAQGFTNEEIVARLHLSEFTVKNHIQCIMKHMAADSRHEAVDRLRASGRSLRLRPLRISLSLQTTHVRRHSEPASVE